MNSYKEAVDFLTERLPIFSNIGSDAIKVGLDNITKLCAAYGDPQQKFPSVHIAGTNGKGSTSHMIAGAFQYAGYKTGLYTSPHLIDLRERIRINGLPVSEAFVVNFVDRAKTLIEEIQPSYFELNVAMAFAAFAEEKVDIAVIETGLGGRLDSTNIIHPVLSVITNIDLDHTQILGETRAEIATEKAGIIKEKVPVVIGETHEETEQVFFLNALKKNTTVVYADSLWDLVRTGQDQSFQYFKAIHSGTQEMVDLRTDLLGSFQVHNIKTVLTACDLLKQMGWNLPLQGVLKSLESVKKITGLRGRWDWIQKNPNIILDVAHNPAGMKFLVDNLESVRNGVGESGAIGKLLIICGFVKDKDVSAALEVFPKDAFFFFTCAKVPRAMPHTDLLAIGESKGLQGQAFATVKDALIAALEFADPTDTILVTGSFFIVGEAMEEMEGTS